MTWWNSDRLDLGRAVITPLLDIYKPEWQKYCVSAGTDSQNYHHNLFFLLIGHGSDAFLSTSTLSNSKPNKNSICKINFNESTVATSSFADISEASSLKTF